VSIVFQYLGKKNSVEQTTPHLNPLPQGERKKNGKSARVRGRFRHSTLSHNYGVVFRGGPGASAVVRRGELRRDKPTTASARGADVSPAA